jgi:branched-subunit amino acid aminotransferase/4-amino-4-deoxychorismate lyase
MEEVSKVAFAEGFLNTRWFSTMLPSRFLLEHPRGAYTCFRGSVHPARLDALVELHKCRLLESARVLGIDARHLEPLLHDVLRRAQSAAGSKAVLSTMLLCVLEQEVCLRTHAWPIPAAPPATKFVLITAAFRRANPNAKDSQWVRDRAELEALKSKYSAREVAMTDDAGFILEGLVTNIFLLSHDGELFTAPDDVVLCGSTRSLVLRAAEELGVHVERQALAPTDPRIRSAFCTSAVQLCTPVHEILLHGRPPLALEVDVALLHAIKAHVEANFT